MALNEKTKCIDNWWEWIYWKTLIQTLYKKYNIYVVDRKKVKLNLKNLKFFKSNISNTKLINKIISNNDIKIVIHLAAKINAAESVLKKNYIF